MTRTVGMNDISRVLRETIAQAAVATIPSPGLEPGSALMEHAVAVRDALAATYRAAYLAPDVLGDNGTIYGQTGLGALFADAKQRLEHAIALTPDNGQGYPIKVGLSSVHTVLSGGGTQCDDRTFRKLEMLRDDITSNNEFEIGIDLDRHPSDDEVNQSKATLIYSAGAPVSVITTREREDSYPTLDEDEIDETSVVCACEIHPDHLMCKLSFDVDVVAGNGNCGCPDLDT